MLLEGNRNTGHSANWRQKARDFADKEHLPRSPSHNADRQGHQNLDPIIWGERSASPQQYPGLADIFRPRHVPGVLADRSVPGSHGKSQTERPDGRAGAKMLSHVALSFNNYRLIDGGPIKQLR